MSAVILSKTYTELPVCQSEIRRYAGDRSGGGATAALLAECLEEARGQLSYRVCYRKLAVSAEGDVCDFGVFRLTSKNLAKNLAGCRRAILFAATVGVGIDRLIAKYGRISPAKALMFQAIGAERIEALCDAFCDDMAKETCAGLRPRFSPGYGDVPLAVQRDIFSVLDCPRQIGLSLNDSLLMSPSKSVTAFVGLSDGGDGPAGGKCGACGKKDCAFRGAL